MNSLPKWLKVVLVVLFICFLAFFLGVHFFGAFLDSILDAMFGG